MGYTPLLISTNYSPNFAAFMWFLDRFRSVFLEEMSLIRLTLVVSRVSVDAVP